MSVSIHGPSLRWFKFFVSHAGEPACDQALGDERAAAGGDEFVCVMPGATIEDARQRFGAIQTELAANPSPCEIRTGFAELAQDDSPADLIERADGQLHTNPKP